MKLRLLEIGPGKEVWHESRVRRKSRQDDGVGEVWIHGGQGICLARAKGVSDMEDLPGPPANAGKRAIAHHLRHVGQGGNFQEGLDLILWFSVGGVADAQSVIGQGVVAMRESAVDVGVVIVVEWQIPITTISKVSTYCSIAREG